MEETRSELESGFPEDFGFGLFDDISEGATHPLLIDDYEDEVETKRKLKDRGANIYTPVKGSTQLHRAIRGMDEARIQLLIDAYREDFEKVRSYLEKEFQWDSRDRQWLRKTILIANSAEDCETAKRLENKQITPGELREAVFVLLQNPVNGEEVAILHPDESTRLSVIQLINRLIPNGFLSWSTIEAGEKHETLMEAAASRGLNHVIDRLHELGAPIAIPGHNPLLSACRSSKKDTIQWLLTKHFDSFDCTLRDEQQNNALIVAMQKKDRKMFDLCLEKMIAYCQKYRNETETEAFSHLFRFEAEDLNNLSIFTFLGKGPVSESIERAIEKYEIDLAYQWQGVTILVCMMCRNIAKEYCYEGIRKNPKLLGMVVYGSTTVLHEAIRFKHLDFLRDLYQRTPAAKEHFNSEGGFNLLSTVLYQKNEDTVEFILEHHMDFLKSDVPKLKGIVCGDGFSKDHYDHNSKLLTRYFPEYAEEIEQARAKARTHSYSYGVERAFTSIGIDVSKIDDLPKPYSSIRGSKGETLLHLAVENDNKDLFIKLVEAGCELDTLDDEGNHPIHFVQSVSMLDLIVNRHPKGHNLVNLTNQDGCSVLHKVCSLRMEKEPLIALLEKVIGLGADVHQLTNEGESVVFFLGSGEALKVFRKQNVQLDTVTKDGETALLRHLRNGNVWMARTLLQHVHQLPTFKDHAHKYLEPMLGRNRDFFSCDYQDFLEENPETTKLLFDSLYEHSREEASRVFSKVCGSAHNFVSGKFLEFDYDLDYNYKNDNNYTPIVGLLSYMEEPNKHIVEKLLQKGVDLKIRNDWGRDALLSLVSRFKSAKWYGHDTGTVQLLLDHGAAVNTADEDGNTPLHLAFSSDGEGELIDVLIRNGADLGLKNKKGKVPLQMTSAMSQELFYFLT
uniref:Putative integrin-linked kinase n=1 Tax=Culex tarsalis TaxID=7177 RepID=A0A1Q3FZY2_CULTA